MGKIYEHIITCILLQMIKKSVTSFANVNAILQREMSQKKNFKHISARISNLSHKNVETCSFYGNNVGTLVSDSSDLGKYVILMAGFGHVYPFKAYWLCDAPKCVTFKNCTICLHCIYVFSIYLRKNSDLCHLQHKLIGCYNRD